MARSRRYTDEEFADAVAASRSMAQALQKLGLSATGANYKLAKARVERLGISMSHFTGQGWLRGGHCSWGRKSPLTDILIQNSSYMNTSALKRRLIAEKMLEEKCSRCGLVEWMGQPAPLVLDHKNGKNRDHRIENLRLLCPNCHAQTPTFAGRNNRRR